MKNIFTLYILLLVVTISYSQYNPFERLSSVKENPNLTYHKENLLYYLTPTNHNSFAPSGNVPFPINYCDYVTDGNNMRRLIMLGDTVVVAADINPDRTGPPPIETATRVYYQVSYNGGLTWLSDALNTSPDISTRWTNIYPIFNYGLRSVIIMGREYFNNSTLNQRGLVLVEELLGLGSLYRYITPSTYCRDYFGSYKNTSMLGGIISSPPISSAPTDTLWYMDFNYNTVTYGTPKHIADSIDVNYRYNCEIASNGQNIMAVRWKSSNLWYPQAYYVHESIDGGNTWSAGTMVGNANLVNSDSCVAWSSFDAIYKPGTTQKCLAFATVSPANQPTKAGCKILFWSPSVNSGNPVVICDYRKYNYYYDTTLWDHNLNNIQVGMTPFSHPSLAYSDDGTRLYCTFSAIQKDTSSYSTGKNYHYNNILICASFDNGANWSRPYYIINSQKRDETYPTLAKKGNNANYINIVYSESGSPGSFTFNDNAPADTVYTVFKKINLYVFNINNNDCELPSKYLLMQNYPNPFNPSTNIKYQISSHGGSSTNNKFITLKIFDILGKEISTLVNEKQKPGTYEVNFDAGKLPSGIYFYSLYADGRILDTKKLILLK